MKRAPLAYSRHMQEACLLLGSMIREARIDRNMTVQDLADRVGVSRGLIQRVERGDRRCAIGVVLEAAVILGIPLFSSSQENLQRELGHVQKRLALLPKRVVNKRDEVDDDF